MIAEQIGHVADHQARQAAAHAGDVQQLLLCQPAPLLYIFLLHLGHDGPAAAKGIAAKFEKLPEQAGGPAFPMSVRFLRCFHDMPFSDFFYR